MSPLITAFIYGFISSFAFAMIFELRGITLLTASLGGGLSWFTYQFAVRFSQSYITPYFIAVVLSSAYAELMARRMRKPATLYLIVAMLPLVPGQSIYDTMYALTNGKTSQALQLATRTFAVSGTIAMGMLITSTIVRLLNKSIRKN